MTRTILVADDDEANRELLKEILEAQGLEVITAPDGLAALKEVVRVKPDLVLLDAAMPYVDGFEVCRQIKKDPERRLIPVILITGLSAVEDRVRGIKAGAGDFLTKPVERIELMARVHSLLNLKAYTDELERAESVLFALAHSIEAKDPYTHGHCERLAEYSTRLGERIGLEEEQIVALRRAGVVHDVGKVAVPDSILLKPGKLTESEWVIMREHPITGEKICSPLKSFHSVLPIIRHHHEKLDGTGYPDGLKGDNIPVTARILQIVDVYDALTTKRPYKQELSCTEAFTIMEDEVRRGWWDRDLFEQFQREVDPLEKSPLPFLMPAVAHREAS
ncbi:MAG TPA: HD domain-containing phosphohydrolase [Terriglobales bacterium]|jgi:putative two-component system response regulator|nr:HD domain-containing phosphohydrolase [Terriglobales bacterium]